MSSLDDFLARSTPDPEPAGIGHKLEILSGQCDFCLGTNTDVYGAKGLRLLTIVCKDCGKNSEIKVWGWLKDVLDE